MKRSKTTIAHPPIAGQWYRRRGYLFRVDLVKNGDSVYVARWPDEANGVGIGYLLRVTLETWQREMAGAKPLPVQARRKRKEFKR